MDILTFFFENKELHAFEVDNQVWFMGVELAKSLNFMNGHGAIRNHCSNTKYLNDFEDEKNIPKPFSPTTKIIPECDVYKLIFRSKNPDKDKLESIIFNKIIPKFRKKNINQDMSLQPVKNEKIEIVSPSLEKFEESLKLMAMAISTTLFTDEEKKKMFFSIQSGFGLPNFLGYNKDIIDIEDNQINRELEPYIESAIKSNNSTVESMNDNLESSSDVDLRPLARRFEVKPINIKKEKKKKPSKSQEGYEAKKKMFSDINPKTVSEMLKENNSSLKSIKFNNYLVLMGVLKVVERVVQSRTSHENKSRVHHVLNEKYSRYGDNVENPYNKYETLVKWNPDNFKELLQMVYKFAEQ